MNELKQRMAEVATLYYEKKYTQQEIADALGITRQTVSKLLGDAVNERIVEIIVHNPEKDCAALQERLCERFGLRAAVVCGVSGKSETVRTLMTVKAAVRYLSPLFERGGQNVAVSWGRTMQALVEELPEMHTRDNTVFPLFGATDNVDPCFLSNELARGMADKLGARVQYAWFPYLPDNTEDAVLLKRTSCYKQVRALWEAIDIAVVGIGNTAVLDRFEHAFGRGVQRSAAIGDIATRFFTEDGKLLELYENTLCASVDNLKNAKTTVAIACGAEKISAIVGALRTGLVDVLVTDEHTAKELLL